ncbi:MAG: hypothetical protein JWN08_261 [Frankiales bacterium]|nr:hypothetical protein [Frankiales bacterium]
MVLQGHRDHRCHGDPADRQARAGDRHGRPATQDEPARDDRRPGHRPDPRLPHAQQDVRGVELRRVRGPAEQQDARDRERVAAHQERLERALADLALLLAPVATTGVNRVVVTAGGTLLHRPDCRATAGLAVTEVTVDDTALGLCRLCQPVAPPARRSRAATRTRAPR